MGEKIHSWICWDLLMCKEYVGILIFSNIVHWIKISKVTYVFIIVTVFQKKIHPNLAGILFTRSMTYMYWLIFYFFFTDFANNYFLFDCSPNQKSLSKLWMKPKGFTMRLKCVPKAWILMEPHQTPGQVSKILCFHNEKKMHKSHLRNYAIIF